eukprot:6913943-Alexandrium_andersonii.AAC.1
MAWTAGRRTLEAYGLLVQAAASNLEEAVVAVLRILPTTGDRLVLSLPGCPGLGVGSGQSRGLYLGPGLG